MHVKKVYRNEAVVLPEADGYLVQYKFKNGFKDFRLGDCMFAKDLNSLDALAKTADDMTALAFYFTAPEKTPEATIKKATKFLLGKGCDVVPYKNHPGEYNVYAARDVKVWPLKDGEPVPAGISFNITMDHQHLTSKEYNAYVHAIKDDFYKKFPDFG